MHPNHDRIKFLKKLLAVTILLPLLLLPLPLKAEESSPLRLDRKVVPTSQTIDLVLDAGRPDYTGSVRIDLRVDEATDSFRFHAEELTLTSVSLKRKRSAVPIRHESGEGGLVIVKSAKPLRKGNYTLEVRFSNRFNRQAAALYKVETGGESYLFTQFEAWDARKAFPCWDEPGFKIPYQIAVTVPERHLAVSNSPIEKEKRAQGRKRIVFAKTPPLPSYLLAIAAGPFETVPIPGLSVPGRIITVKGNKGLTGEAGAMAPKILDALEVYFKSPYPYDKLDLIAVPEFLSGAMENPGAVTFRESGLLIETPSVEQRRRLASVMAHELAHMWFGNLVTMAWWDDLWLNESFASWMGDKIADQVFPEFKISVMEVRSVQYAMDRDTLAAAGAIRKPVAPTDNPLQSFSALAYMKGEGILAMVEQWIGAENFRRGVLHYLEAHRMGNAVAEDFWSALSQFAGRDIGEIMAPFLNQPGVPLVEAALLSDGQVRLTQRRLLYPGNESPPIRWPIPVVLRYPDGNGFMTQKFLLTEESETFRLKSAQRPAWIHPNAGERGYYRWRVPPEMLEWMLADARSALSVRERVGLLGHLPALLDAGSLPGDKYLRAVGRFSADPQPEVLLALLDAVDKVRSDFIAPGGPGLEEPFARYVQATLGPALGQIGLSGREGEDEVVSLLRPTLIEWLGEEGKDPEMLAYGRSLAASFLKDSASVDTNLTSVGLELSAVEGDRALFEKYKERFETAATPAERARFLSALGRFRDPQIVASALEYALDGPLRPQELLSIPQGIASDPRYRDRVFDWVMEHYEEIRARRPARSLIYLPFFASGCSADRLKKALDFFSEPSHRQPGIEVELRKLEEGVFRCVRLREREGRAVAEYLRHFTGGIPAAQEEGSR